MKIVYHHRFLLKCMYQEGERLYTLYVLDILSMFLRYFD